MREDQRPFGFERKADDGLARLGEITTAHGMIRTPAFMPVGTAATVKAVYPDQVRAAGADVVLANTYHLMLRPGAGRIHALGGLHAFMQWPHPVLTDSGGFQVMSLAPMRTITDEGVMFRSHLDGSQHMLTPERAVEIQCLLGSDIQMQLDECVALPAADAELTRAVDLSLRWAQRAQAAFAAACSAGAAGPGQALFAIVQGGTDRALRQRSADALVAMDFPGYAIGGLAVGEGHDAMVTTLAHTVSLLPGNKPRYLMGVGTPKDIIAAVAQGIDMFDCVMPTRAGRHGHAYTWAGRVNLRNARHAEDPRPLDPLSKCPAARCYSRAYLHHLFKAGEYLGPMLLSWANVWFYQELMATIRAAIADGRLVEFATQYAEKLNSPEPR